MADASDRLPHTTSSAGQGNPSLPDNADNTEQVNLSGSTRDAMSNVGNRTADTLTAPDDDTTATMVDHATLTTPGTVDTNYDAPTTVDNYPSTGVGAANQQMEVGMTPMNSGAAATGNRYYSPNEGREHLSGLFNSRAAAENAVARLESLGVPRSDISVILRNENETADFAASTGTESGSKAGEGAGAGSVVGGTVGAILGALAATATSVAIPGVGVLLAGPIAGALAGAGAGGLAGGLLGALVGAGIPEETARSYESGLQQGGVVVVADVPAHLATEARAVLNAQGDLSNV